MKKKAIENNKNGCAQVLTVYIAHRDTLHSTLIQRLCVCEIAIQRTPFNSRTTRIM